MFKLVIIFVLAVASTSAAPGALLASYTAPIAAPAVVTASSSQVIARNYNTLAAPLVAAPVAVAAPLKAAPVAVTAPLAAVSLAYSGYGGYVAPAAYAAAPAYYI